MTFANNVVLPGVTRDPKEMEKILVPECCRKGLDSCEHVAKKQKKKKQNIGL